MVSPPEHESSDEPAGMIPDALPALEVWVRAGLLIIAAGLVLVFGIACWLNPYEADGQPRRLETHRQMGLPPCNFKVMTGLPCPSCGMTTSFALLMHGDISNSLRANAVGTLLACFWLILIPWSVACAWHGRPYGVRSIEQGMMLAAVVFVTLMMLRWVVVVASTLVGW